MIRIRIRIMGNSSFFIMNVLALPQAPKGDVKSDMPEFIQSLKL
jgi:hypothetical protein